MRRTTTLTAALLFAAPQASASPVPTPVDALGGYATSVFGSMCVASVATGTFAVACPTRG